MKRIFLASILTVCACAAAGFIADGLPRVSTHKQAQYWVQLDNAFGLIQGGDLKIAGVRAGTITDLKLDRQTMRAKVGFRITLFEACSAFTRVTACMLAKSPCGDPLHRRLRRVRRLPRRSDCYRLERQLPGGSFTRWVRASFHGAPNYSG